MEKILISGASDGIGKAIAYALANKDNEIILLGRNTERLKKIKDNLSNKCFKAHAYSFDFNDLIQSANINIIEEISCQHPNITTIINNAGIWHRMSQIEDISDNDIDSVINTNLTAHIKVVKAFLPNLRKQSSAVILNVISKSGVTAQNGQSVYSASKWGMRGFTEVLKNDLADTNIRVGAIYQNGTNTDMFSKANEELPVNEFTEPEDLAEVVRFILSRPAKLWIHEIHITF